MIFHFGEFLFQCRPCSKPAECKETEGYQVLYFTFNKGDQSGRNVAQLF